MGKSADLLPPKKMNDRINDKNYVYPSFADVMMIERESPLNKQAKRVAWEFKIAIFTLVCYVCRGEERTGDQR
ncbi:hypothetical protein J7E71_15935 [Mesobacillus foraminis]|uniref:hypothetical protein n=1 Tax=Mesobacillus foraminis TaxID=279826 RepID=UPI001BE5D51C|nr:hypothetical protein [Mesobacillus foraminis]MBT2757417.1 hypothetical protein [Mesobacillus foraminis]